MTKGFCGFRLLLGGGGSCGEGAGLVAGVGLGFKFFSFLSANHTKHQNIKFSKNIRTFSFCRKFL